MICRRQNVEGFDSTPLYEFARFANMHWKAFAQARAITCGDKLNLNKWMIVCCCVCNICFFLVRIFFRHSSSFSFSCVAYCFRSFFCAWFWHIFEDVNLISDCIHVNMANIMVCWGLEKRATHIPAKLNNIRSKCWYRSIGDTMIPLWYSEYIAIIYQISRVLIVCLNSVRIIAGETAGFE